MMNHSAFDDHLKKQFGDFQPEVPPHIWENIVNNRQKRRPVAWWNRFLKNGKILFALSAILLGTAGYFLFVRNNKDISSSDLSSANPISAQTESQPASSRNQETAGNQQHSSNLQAQPVPQPASVPDQPVTSQQPSGISQTMDPVTANKTSDTDKQVPVSSNTIANKKSTSSRQSSQQHNRTNTVSSSALTSTKNKNNRPALPDEGFAGQRQDQNDGLTTNTNSRKLKKDRQRSSVLVSAGETGDGANTFTNQDQTSVTPGRTDAGMADLNRQVLDWQKLQDEKSFRHRLISKSFNLSPIPCPERNAAGNKKYFEFYGSGDYSFRKFNDTAHSQYLQKRKESTKITTGFSAGFRYTRVFSNAMSFRVGLNYSQVNEKFTYTQGNIIQVVYITNSNGDTIGSNMTSSTRYKVTHNRYKTIDVPLTIGYEIGNERLHANINAGVIMNVYSWQKGDVLDSAYKPVSITTGKNSSPYQFKTNIGLGFTGAASIYYKLGEKWHLLAEPYIRYNLSPANKADITLKQKFTTIGLRLGLRLDL